MPRVSRWLVRTAWLHFLLAGTWGALLLTAKAWPSLGHWIWRLRPWHIDTMLVGWVAQLIMGVLFWWLPKLPGGTSRGPTAPVWLAYGLLNAGVLLGWLGLASLGRGLELASGAVFLVNAWPRIRPLVRARPLREKARP